MKSVFFRAVFAASLITGGAAIAQEKAGPKNVILMIGDGMGFAQVEAGSLYAYGEPKGQPYWDFHVFATTTHSSDGQGYDPEKAAADFSYVLKDATDSAAAATTLSSGVKTYDGAIGVDAEGKPVRHLYQDAEEMGKATGVLSTVYISHATPAAFTTHHSTRKDVDVLAEDMIRNSTLDVLIGAGHPWYNDNGDQIGGLGEDPFKTEGSYSRIGGEAVWREIQAGTAGSDADGDGQPDPWTLVDTLAGFKALADKNAPGERILGIVPVASTLHGNRDGDKEADPYVVPPIATVPDMATLMEGALNALSADPDGFFLMAEGGAIDWGGHANVIGRTIEEQRDFDKAVEAVVKWVETNSSWEDTLLIITADHETGYLTGPNAKPEWEPLENKGKGEVPGYAWHTGSHTNQPVPTFAKGAGAEKLLEAVEGEDVHYGRLIDNTDIAKTIRAVWR